MLLAGIDIGNATTEVVIAETAPATSPVLRWRGLSRTRGPKGSEESLRAAARLLSDGERELRCRCHRLGLAVLEPVRTALQPLDVRPQPPGSPLVVVSGRSGTPAGAGLGVGRHMPLAELDQAPSPGPLVASVRAAEDFETAAAALAAASQRGWEIVGVVAEGDDAVLIAARSGLGIPVVDEVDVVALASDDRLAVEVAADESSELLLADAFRLADVFALQPRELPAVHRVVRHIAERRAVALVRRPTRDPASEPTIVLERAGRVSRIPAARAVAELRDAHPGAIDGIQLPGAAPLRGISDVFGIDLAALDDGAWVRRANARLRGTPMAVLGRDSQTDAADRLAELTGQRVTGGHAESRMAALGAATTPGAPAGAAMCDLGAGTIDLVSGEEHAIVAGAGALLTLAVAFALGVPEALAEQIKRRRSLRVQTPHIAHDEDGRRRYLDGPAPAEAVGRLCVVGTDGELLPFSDTMAPEEWRALRLAIKREVVAANVARALRALSRQPRVLVAAGGTAADSEVVRMLAERLAGSVVVGRANIAGLLATRGAVAWGLLLQLADERESRRAA